MPSPYEVTSRTPNHVRPSAIAPSRTTRADGLGTRPTGDAHPDQSAPAQRSMVVVHVTARPVVMVTVVVMVMVMVMVMAVVVVAVVVRLGTVVVAVVVAVRRAVVVVAVWRIGVREQCSPASGVHCGQCRQGLAMRVGVDPFRHHAGRRCRRAERSRPRPIAATRRPLSDARPTEDELADQSDHESQQEPEDEYAGRVGGGDGGADDDGVPYGAAAPGDIGGHDRLAVAGEGGVGGAEQEGERHASSPTPRSRWGEPTMS